MLQTIRRAPSDEAGAVGLQLFTGCRVAEHEETYLAQCLKDGVCPTCRKPIVTKHGSGSFEEGVFCSFDCDVKWRGGALIRKYQGSQSGAADE